MTKKTKLDAVLAEDWTTDLVRRRPKGPISVELHRVVPCGDGAELDLLDDLDAARTKIAVLGKHALALILKHELDGGDVAGNPICPDCTAPGSLDVDLDRRVGTHRPGCLWGAVVETARSLG